MISAGLPFRIGRLGRIFAIAVCASLLAGCQVRLGWVSLLDDEPAIAAALSAIQSSFKGPVRALKLTIADSEMVFQAESPRTPGQISEWRLAREQFMMLSFDRVHGPRRIEPVLINRNLDQNLFDLKEVDLAVWAKIADAAIARAKLESKAGVASIELSRSTVLLPATASGAPRWVVEVKSVSESARIFANVQGEITGANLRGTNRMRNLNMYQRPELAGEAAAEFRRTFGSEPILLRVSFNSTSIGFETTRDDKNHPIVRPGDGLKVNAVYDWSLNGLTHTMGRPNISRGLSNPDAPFGVDEVDWALLPKIVADARVKLAMPNGRVTSINAAKPTDGVGAPVPVWTIYIEENGERGEYTADAKGAVKKVLLPKSKRPPTDWLAPATVAQTLTRIAAEFGEDTRIANILIDDQGARITAEDPRNPGKPTRVLLRDEGFTRFGTPLMISEGRPFTMRDLKGLSEQRIAALAERTLKELKMPTGSVVRYTFGRGVLQASRRGTVTAEVRAETQSQGHGRAVLELDGSVVEVIRP